MERQRVHFVLHKDVQVHHLIADTKVVAFTQFQQALSFADCLTHHTAGDQHVEVCIAHTHIRSGFRRCPEFTRVLFKRIGFFHLLLRQRQQFLQGKSLLVQMMLRYAGDHLQPRIEVVRLQLQRLAEIFHVLFLGCCLLCKIQIIVGCFGCVVFLRGTLLIVLCEELFRQCICIVLTLDLVCVRIQETL